MLKYLAIALLFFCVGANATMIRVERPGYAITFTESAALLRLDKAGFNGRCEFAQRTNGIDNANKAFTAMFYNCPYRITIMLKNYVDYDIDGIIIFRMESNAEYVNEVINKSSVKMLSQ